MTTKAELAARAKYDNLIEELSITASHGNKQSAYDANKMIFNVKGALSLARKAKETANEYDFDLEPLEVAKDKVFNDLMEQKKFDQAEKFAKELNL